MPQKEIRIPADDAATVWMRYNPLPRQSPFNPGTWPRTEMSVLPDGWFATDLSSLGLPDGPYEYDVVIRSHSGAPDRTGIADPYAREITRYGGYRGIFRILNGEPFPPAFDWTTEPDLTTLPGNHQIVVYELPMRWVDSSVFDQGEGYARQVGLGTFDKALFEQLDAWQETGINCIELTPIQDSSDTLNWGYGTRFFFAPDLDMGEPYDLKMFILACHQKGIRVILDVVMNHSRNAPLEQLAYDRFYLRNSGDPQGYFLGGADKAEREGRPDWGGKVFRYASPVGGVYESREFQYGMAEAWIREYHIDGFRIDEFKGIDNWDFIRAFTARAHSVNDSLFPGRPFFVVAEDAWRRAEITEPDATGHPVADAVWDFDFQAGLRRLITNTLTTAWGKPPDCRRELVKALIRGGKTWNDADRTWRTGTFRELTNRIIYPTSHDVEPASDQRLADFLRPYAGEPAGNEADDAPFTPAGIELQVAAFALTCTAVGVPMFLAGEEFAEVHDVAHGDWKLKMSDVVDWYRRELPGHREVFARVKELTALRCTTSSLHTAEVEFFALENGFHPSFNDDGGQRVFCYARTGGRKLGEKSQVIVVANCSSHTIKDWTFEPWPWQQVREAGGKGQPLPHLNGPLATISLDPFQVRVFLS